MRRLTLACLLMCCASQLAAKTAQDVDRFRVAVSGTLTSSDSYSFDASFHYMLCRYAGIGCAIGFWSNYFEDGYASGDNWNIDEDYEKPTNVYLRPSAVLKTPAIRCRACAWSLFAEPGLILNLPYQRVCIESTPNWPNKEYHYISTTKGQWLAFDLRAGINLDVGPVGISAGYMISNLNIFSQYRHLSYQGVSFREFYSSKPLMQGAYLTIYYTW